MPSPTNRGAPGRHDIMARLLAFCRPVSEWLACRTIVHRRRSCIVDDERSNLHSLERIFQREGFRTLLAANGAAGARACCRKHRVDVVLTDLMMPGTSGIELLKALQTVAPETEVVLMTAYGTVETAVEAMREGAYDFVEKPLKRMHDREERAQGRRAPGAARREPHARKELSALRNRAIVGTSPALRRVLEVATQAAPSSATVLVLGESGTGKELLARYIHEHSGRERPVRRVNCAAHPRDDPRGRAVRPREGRVHRRGRAARRALREAARRHAVPRRDRRALASACR